MTSYKRVALSVVAVLLLSLPLFGQYTATYGASPADVLNSSSSPSSAYNCVSNSCWVELTANTTSFSQFTASDDGEVQGIDASGDRDRWITSTQEWQSQNSVDGSLAGHWKAIYLGDFANNSYLGLTTASSNNAYTWSGGAWVNLTPGTCSQGAASPDGNLYCIGVGSALGDVFHWVSGTGWVLIRNNSDAAAITANADGVTIVTTSSYVYIWDTRTSTWTQAGSPTSLGFTPSAAAGSIGLSDDGSISILGTLGNVNVSHDNGTTWSEPKHAGLTLESVVNSNLDRSFILASTGQIYHLNVIVPQTKMSISGTCGSACGSGNPAVQVDYSVVNGQYNGSASVFSCSSPWVFNWDGDSPNECGFNTYANTVLSTPIASSFQTNCDTFAPGTACNSNITFSITVVLTAGALVVFNDSKQCDCIWHTLWVNQKYDITTSTTGAPSGQYWFGGYLWGTYTWGSVGMTQWCSVDYMPLLDVYGNHVKIQYKNVGPPAPTAMPGQYINGDVWAEENSTGTIYYPMTNILGTPVMRNYHVGGNPLNIYTWDNTHNLFRGPGGNPTTPCQGVPIS